MQWLRSNRWLPAGGVIFVVLLVILQIALPTPPKARDSAATVTTFFLHHHRAGLIAAIVQGIAMLGLACLIATLAATVHKAGEELLAVITFAGGLLAAGTAMIGIAIQTSLSYRVALDSPAVTKGLYDVALVVFTLVGFPAALFAGTTALAVWRTRMLPDWYGWLTGVAAVVVLLGAGALKHGGFYSPDGAAGFIPFIVLLAWVFLTSALLVRRDAGTATVGRPGTAM